MGRDTSEVWRWNVDDIWQTYSSMYQEMHNTDESNNEFERTHHLSAVLLFGGCAIESFLNSHYRFVMKDFSDEQTILKDLRYTPLKDKLKKWPDTISGGDIDSSTQTIISEYLDLRNEVTHRKRNDHSLYAELEITNPKIFVDAVKKAFLTIYFNKGEAYPYWLMGWNYVGFNFNSFYPYLASNQQFKHSLRKMGFNVPAWEYHEANEWEEKYMKSFEGYCYLEKEYYSKAPIIEPMSSCLLQAPRLCKRWWDKSIIQKD